LAAVWFSTSSLTAAASLAFFADSSPPVIESLVASRASASSASALAYSAFLSLQDVDLGPVSSMPATFFFNAAIPAFSCPGLTLAEKFLVVVLLETVGLLSAGVFSITALAASVATALLASFAFSSLVLGLVTGLSSNAKV